MEKLSMEELNMLNKISAIKNTLAIVDCSGCQQSGAVRLARRHLRNANPDNWDGENGNEMPRSFNPHPVRYRIDEGHEIRIEFMRDPGYPSKWIHRVDYIVCGMVSCTCHRYGIGGMLAVEHLSSTIQDIALDYPEVWLGHFQTDAQLFLQILKPIPVNGSLYYRPESITLDMSKEAVAAYQIFDASGQFPNLNGELVDNDYLGGDNDFHIALMVNSIGRHSALCKIPDSIAEWAKKYANGETFDTYFDRLVGSRN